MDYRLGAISSHDSVLYSHSLSLIPHTTQVLYSLPG